MGALKTTHNAGFFSCCSYRFTDIVIYFNEHKELPELVDSSEQLELYKENKDIDLTPMYFSQVDSILIPYKEPISISDSGLELQFSPYKQFNFSKILPFLIKYFTPSRLVISALLGYNEKYKIDYKNTCAVFYRGNDKNRETTIAPYHEFINKAKQVDRKGLKFLVQPDETEFLEAFISEFGKERVIFFEETPHIRKQDSAVFYQIPPKNKASYAAMYFAAVLALSKCDKLITHSGNGGNWAVWYRGHANDVHQWLNDKWI